MIQNGELGEIFAVNGSYQQDWLFRETDYSWRLEPEFSGDSRAVSDIGSHWLDAAEFMTGLDVKKVCADFATFYPVRKKPLKPAETYSGKELAPKDYVPVPIQTEDYASVLLRFKGGAHGALTVNQVAAGRKKPHLVRNLRQQAVSGHRYRAPKRNVDRQAGKGKPHPSS